MTVEIPDLVLLKSGFSEQDLRLRIAIALFADDIFTLGQAAKFCGLHQIELQRELAKRKIPLHYGLEEYRDDRRTLAQIA